MEAVNQSSAVSTVPKEWLLYVVVLNGKALYIGPNGEEGDIFCMIHTQIQGEPRSRTAVTGMVYNSAHPSWPSNGNGNAFVFPIRDTGKTTELVVTIWDGSDSMEEANPIGKIEIDLELLMHVSSSSNGDRDFLPQSCEYLVDLVPNLCSQTNGENTAALSLICARAEPIFNSAGGKEGAVADLLRRLQVRRQKDRLNRLAQWNLQYAGKEDRSNKPRKDYSLVSLLTSDNSPKNVDESWSPPDPPPLSNSSGPQLLPPPALSADGDAPLEGLVERLAQTAPGNSGCAVAAPLRAQAALLARLRPVEFEDGEIILAAGFGPASFFFIRSGYCAVYLNGESVNCLGPGQFLGEIGLLFGDQRLADVRADGPCSLFELDGEDLWLALDMFPGLFTELKRLAAVRYERVRGQCSEISSDSRRDTASLDVSKNKLEAEGPLREFQLFLQNVASHIHCAADERGSRRRDRSDGQRSQRIVRTRSEESSPSAGGRDEHFSSQTVAPCASAEEVLERERLLANRLESMERAGAFRRRECSNDSCEEAVQKCSGHDTGNFPDQFQLSSSMRAAVVPLVGSLEQARSRSSFHTGLPACAEVMGLSPPTTDGWDHSPSLSDSEESLEIRNEDPSTSLLRSEMQTKSVGLDVWHEEKEAHASLPTALARSNSFVMLESHHSMRRLIRSASMPMFVDKPLLPMAVAEARMPVRKGVFLTRFRRAHDTYTAEEIGVSPRNFLRLVLSDLCLQLYKEENCSYLMMEGKDGTRLLRSELVRGEDDLADTFSAKVTEMELAVEDGALNSGTQLRARVVVSRALWGDRISGSALISLQDAMARPGVPMQRTYELSNDGYGESVKAAGGDAAGKGRRVSGLMQRLSFGSSRQLEEEEDAGAVSRGKAKGTLTVTVQVREVQVLPFWLSIPAVTPAGKARRYMGITDHLGRVCAQLEFLGYSRCPWCVRLGEADAFRFEFHPAPCGAPTRPAGALPEAAAAAAGPCAACAGRGWSEGLTLWDADLRVRLGGVVTDVTPRKHSRARLWDQNEAHFASVRAAAAAEPDLCGSVRFKVPPTFPELSVRSTGSVISGRAACSSFQVHVHRDHQATAAAGPSTPTRRGTLAADISRGAAGEPATVLVQPGQDAVRSMLLAVGIAEACRLRPRTPPNLSPSSPAGPSFRDKFDRCYDDRAGPASDR